MESSLEKADAAKTENGPEEGTSSHQKTIPSLHAEGQDGHDNAGSQACEEQLRTRSGTQGQQRKETAPKRKKPTLRRADAAPRGRGAHAAKQSIQSPKGPSRDRQLPAPSYSPALDGLRALAVAAVIVYHLGFSWAPGGLLGVTVFFVLSGYLITSLLVSEHLRNGRIALGSFWLRRVRRLLPAVILVIVTTVILCMIFDRALLTKMRPDILPSLLFVNNWWQIFQDRSYFEALGAPSPLQHFWSLGIEEQFYLIWPLLVGGILFLGGSHKHLRGAALGLSVVSIIAMAILYIPGEDPSRVYYGTDTRAFSLLIGAALGLIWPFGPLGASVFGKHARRLSKQQERILSVASIAALVGLVAMMCFVSGFADILYPWGLLLASVLTAVVIAGMVYPGSLLAKPFSAKPMVWVGKRSYGMYLWHFPLILLICPTDGTTPEWWVALAAVAAVIAVSALSYRFVENPIRKGVIGRVVKRIRSGEVTLERMMRKVAPAFVCCMAACVVAVIGLVVIEDESFVEDTELYKDETPAIVGVSDIENSSSAADSFKPEGLDVLVIGDSVCKKAIYSFPDVFPHGALDAALNRRMSQGAELYQSYLDQGIDSNVIVFALGNNAPVTDEQLDEVMEAVGPDKQVFFVNTRNGTGWMSQTNDILQSATERYPNVHIIDWASTSYGHAEYFEEDGMHLKPDGAEAYTQMIHDAIAPYLPDRSGEESTSPEAQQVNDGESAFYLPAT